MPHHRTVYRAATRAALAAHPHFAGVNILKVWPGSIGAASLPALGVLTPQEPSVTDSQDSVAKRTLLQVVLRRTSDDAIEDQLDDDSVLIEALVLAALRSPEIGVELEETSLVSDSQAGAYVGTLLLTFRVTSWQPPALLS